MNTLKAYAKINLGLRILKKRKDGYHNIETVFYRVNPHDEITLEQAASISLKCENLTLPTDERNLCVKAAKLLQQQIKIKSGAKILLKKNIPIGAGLGGGSSDAATTLLGLVKLWNLDIKHSLLHSIALQLGSDVPYFLQNGTAYATGRGEILEYLSFDVPYWIILVYPNVHISTAWAYQALHEPDSQLHIDQCKVDITLKRILIDHIQDLRQLATILDNDFEPLILHKYEAVSYAKISLYTLGAQFAQMSGSGSAVYGFFSEEVVAKNAFTKLSQKYKVFLTPPHFNPE